MRQFTVRIREDAFDALVHLAVRERRAPREQAALLLEETLRPGPTPPSVSRASSDQKEAARA